MSTEDNKALVRRLYEVVNQHKLGEFLAQALRPRGWQPRHPGAVIEAIRSFIPWPGSRSSRACSTCSMLDL